ncbi:gliding motility lipoprotein GldD [bacterium AH-315-C07]|nr:gliding motility lipoprotein GldD [bacterium AH-315-C07]
MYHRTLLLLLIAACLCSCGSNYSPKPKGYPRIDLPKKDYRSHKPDNCPYSFEYPTYANITNHTGIVSDPCWININFEKFAAKIHISYKTILNQHGLDTLIEDSRNFVYKHTVKADAIDESIIRNEVNNVSGIFYEIGGNTASNLQFFATDSTSHFMRGALYFNIEPNEDSLAPVIGYIREDILKLLSSLKWNDS